MPIYAYRCAECGHELDALQKISEPALKDCPSCHKPALAKKLTAAGFQLKGSGWYQTDFRNGSKPAEKSADAKPDAKAGGTDTATTSKTEAVSETKSEPSSSTPPAAGCGSSCSCH